jgi:hypothetical protein
VYGSTVSKDVDPCRHSEPIRIAIVPSSLQNQVSPGTRRTSWLAARRPGQQRDVGTDEHETATELQVAPCGALDEGVDPGRLPNSVIFTIAASTAR